VIFCPPNSSSIPYLDDAIPPSRFVSFSYSVPVFTRSIIPSPTPSNSSSSSNALFKIADNGSVKVTISLPGLSIITCGDTPVPLDCALPPTNCIDAVLSAELPPSINANSSTSNVRYNS